MGTLMTSETVETALIRRARRLAAEHGLDGFTVERLCEDAGVAPSDFARLFVSKEDAVIGLRLERTTIAATVRFLSGGDGLANDLGPRLLDELVQLAVERWEALDLDDASLADLSAALRREPRLLELVATQIAEQEAFDVRLIVQREDLATADPRAEAAGLMMGRLVHASAREALRGGAGEDFADLLRGRVAALHAFFASQEAPRR